MVIMIASETERRPETKLGQLYHMSSRNSFYWLIYSSINTFHYVLKNVHEKHPWQDEDNNLGKVTLRTDKKIFCYKIQIQRFIEILYYTNILHSSILFSLDCTAIVNFFSNYLYQRLSSKYNTNGTGAFRALSRIYGEVLLLKQEV